jgi:hypothetical protein
MRSLRDDLRQRGPQGAAGEGAPEGRDIFRCSPGAGNSCSSALNSEVDRASDDQGNGGSNRAESPAVSEPRFGIADSRLDLTQAAGVTDRRADPPSGGGGTAPGQASVNAQGANDRVFGGIFPLMRKALRVTTGSTDVRNTRRAGAPAVQ